jgi:hypothetical protein
MRAVADEEQPCSDSLMRSTMPPTMHPTTPEYAPGRAQRLDDLHLNFRCACTAGEAGMHPAQTACRCWHDAMAKAQFGLLVMEMLDVVDGTMTGDFQGCPPENGSATQVVGITPRGTPDRGQGAEGQACRSVLSTGSADSSAFRARCCLWRVFVVVTAAPTPLRVAWPALLP